jgi:hypothetical protein
LEAMNSAITGSPVALSNKARLKTRIRRNMGTWNHGNLVARGW